MHVRLLYCGAVAAGKTTAHRNSDNSKNQTASVSCGTGPSIMEENLSQSSDDDEALGLMRKHPTPVGSVNGERP